MTTIYIDMIDGTLCSVPARAKELNTGMYEISECMDFNPEDTAALLDYIPGDIVRVEDGKAVALVSCADTKERCYWRFLFEVTAHGCPSESTIASSHFAGILKRIVAEIADDTRWHYPAVKEWISHNA